MEIKKNLTYLAALALVASLTACGGDDGPNDGFNPNPNPNPDAGQVDPNPGGDTGGNDGGWDDGGNNDAGNNGGGNDNGGWDDNGNGYDGTDIGGDFIIPENGSIPVEMAVMDASVTCGIANFPQEVMRQLNAARAQARMCGGEYMPAAPAFQYWNVKLQAAAERHSLDMAQNNFYSHTGSDGTNHIDRAIQEGYGSTYVGENIYATPTSIEKAIQGFLESPGHCVNIMRPQFNEIGVACVASNTQYRNLWTFVHGGNP